MGCDFRRSSGASGTMKGLQECLGQSPAQMISHLARSYLRSSLDAYLSSLE
jgi:hypothetical protein